MGRNLQYAFAIPAVLLLVVAYSHRPRRATQWGRAQPAGRKPATADAAIDRLRVQLARSERATEAAAAAMARAAAQTTPASNVRLVEPARCRRRRCRRDTCCRHLALAAAPPLLDCAAGRRPRHVQPPPRPLRHPPFYGGPDCAAPALPGVRDAVRGVFKPEVRGGIHIQPAFPTTCDCLQQCHTLALDARQECVVDLRSGESAAAAGRRAKAAMPWMPLISNETWCSGQRDDAAASAAKLCSGHGVLSVQLPYEFYEGRRGAERRQPADDAQAPFPGYGQGARGVDGSGPWPPQVHERLLGRGK